MKTFFKLAIRSFLILLVIAGIVIYPVYTQPAYADNGTLNLDNFCAGKEDGNYPYPNDCTKYVACVGQTEAYEMDCQLGYDGKPLHYVQSSGPDPKTSYCDYPEKVGCSEE